MSCQSELKMLGKKLAGRYLHGLRLGTLRFRLTCWSQNHLSLLRRFGDTKLLDS
jgi:hypothetical protein